MHLLSKEEKVSYMFDYLSKSLSPYATFNPPSGDHWAVVDILNYEGATHIVVIELPLYGKGKTHVCKVYRREDDLIIKRYDTSIALSLFTSHDKEWSDLFE